MKTLSKILAVTILAALPAALGACGDDSGAKAADAMPMNTPDAMSMGPAAPQLGAQIDRFGRPAINTALTDPFDLKMGMTEDAVKDAYNADSDFANWATNWGPSIAGNAGVLDGLDGTCGNALLAKTGAGQPMAGRYNDLGATLADDEMYLNTASGTCASYLGVEANALGLTNTDCGGRAPSYDVVDVSYTVLAVGPTGLSPKPAVGDGIDSDADGNPSDTTFPFLGSPN